MNLEAFHKKKSELRYPIFLLTFHIGIVCTMLHWGENTIWKIKEMEVHINAL